METPEMSESTFIDQLVRDNIRKLKPYRSARDDFDSGILLDANENALGSVLNDNQELNRYPMPYQEKLRGKIAAYRGVNSPNVFVGVGSDEAIDLLMRIFCKPGEDEIIINPPTYGMYKVSASINDVKVKEVLLDEDFQLQTEKIFNSISPSTKLIFVCSPNNPTANLIREEDIVEIADQFNGIVIVDEAYIDFSKNRSICGVIDDYPNVVVLQTLSKAFGLAGLRLGTAIADEKIINYMMKVKAPYNINKLTSQKAIEAFSNLERLDSMVEKIISERERVKSALESIAGVQHVYKSDANFLLFRVEDALETYRNLAEANVIIRYRGNEPLCDNCLRVTIGTEVENNTFLSRLEHLLK